MNILVTGANGFVGQHLVEHLSLSSHRLFLLHRAQSKMGSLPSPAVLVESELDQFNDFARYKIDIVVDLAWGFLDNFNAPEHLELEVELHFSFLQRALSQGVKAIFVSGSCLEYGLREGICAENNQCFPSTSYGKAKLALFQKVSDLKKHYSFHLTWARLFYVYGEGSSRKSLYNHVIAAKQRGDISFDMSHGSQTRDFISIARASKLMAALIESDKDVGIVNIASGMPITVKDQVKKWLEGTAIQLNLDKFPVPEYEPKHFWANTDKLYNALNILQRNIKQDNG